MQLFYSAPVDIFETGSNIIFLLWIFGISSYIISRIVYLVSNSYIKKLNYN